MAALTKVDIKALRSCDMVTFEYDRTADETVIRTEKYATDDNPWRGCHVIQTQPRLECYVTDYTDPSVITRASHTVYSPMCEPEPTCTVFSLLKPGDYLVVRFIAGNSTLEQREVGFTTDVLSLIIVRDEKRMVFLIAQSTYKASGYSGMCRTALKSSISA